MLIDTDSQLYRIEVRIKGVYRSYKGIIFKVLEQSKLEKYINSRVLLGATYKVLTDIIKTPKENDKIYLLEQDNILEICTHEPIEFQPDMTELFSQCIFSILDISQLDTSKVVSMQQCFFYSKIDKLIMTGLNLSNLTNLSKTFCGFKGNIYGLETITFKEDVVLTKCFESSRILNGIDLSNIPKERLTLGMFSRCTTPIIKIKELNEARFNIFDNASVNEVHIDKLIAYNRKFDFEYWMCLAHINNNIDNITINTVEIRGQTNE